MSNITEFLLARIAEDEQAAQVRTVSHRMIGGKMVDIPMHNAPGLWAWSPERVLAECAAKRQIITQCGWITVQRIWATTLYADHPDYREEWRP